MATLNPPIWENAFRRRSAPTPNWKPSERNTVSALIAHLDSSRQLTQPPLGTPNTMRCQCCSKWSSTLEQTPSSVDATPAELVSGTTDPNCRAQFCHSRGYRCSGKLWQQQSSAILEWPTFQFWSRDFHFSILFSQYCALFFAMQRTSDLLNVSSDSWDWCHLQSNSVHTTTGSHATTCTIAINSTTGHLSVLSFRLRILYDTMTHERYRRESCASTIAMRQCDRR